MQELTVLKIGGNVIDQEAALNRFLKDFASLPGHKILVHGGGNIATDIGNKMGVSSKYKDGRRITDAPTLKLVTMVYAGLINKQIVAKLQSFSCNALGLTGADGNILPANKRPIGMMDYGFVGDVESDDINLTFFQLLLQQNITPVVAPLTHDKKGSLLNTNADTIAKEIAVSLSEIYRINLIYSFEKAGVLLDPSDEKTVIPIMNIFDFKKFVSEGVVSGGMIPKLENAFQAMDQGVDKVIIGPVEQLSDLINGRAGTQII